jgi:hypothetical protein
MKFLLREKRPGTCTKQYKCKGKPQKAEACMEGAPEEGKKIKDTKINPSTWRATLNGINLKKKREGKNKE